MANLVGGAFRAPAHAVNGDDPQVEFWYAQNMLLMVREDHLSASPVLRREREHSTGPYAVVHPRAYLASAERGRPRGVVEWLSIGPAIIAATLRRRLGRADKV